MDYNQRKTLITTFQGVFLFLWIFWFGQDIIHHDLWGAVGDGFFLIHRAWCAYRWWQEIKDDDDDDDDKGTPLRVSWWQALASGA